MRETCGGLNVLVILVDQWPAWAFGHKGARVPTPNIDRLAAEGTVFSNAFTSCPLCSPARGAHNRFDKGPYFYDEVWRIPLVVRHPVAPPAVQDAFVSILDVGQTIFSLIGAETMPNRPRVGRALQPLLGRSARPVDWPQVAYGAYDLYNGMSFAIRAARDERFKYVWNPQAADEFYDLDADPHEMNNQIAGSQLAGEKRRLQSMLFSWLRATGDDLPTRASELPEAGTIVVTGVPGP